MIDPAARQGINDHVKGDHVLASAPSTKPDPSLDKSLPGYWSGELAEPLLPAAAIKDRIICEMLESIEERERVIKRQQDDPGDKCCVDDADNQDAAQAQVEVEQDNPF